MSRNFWEWILLPRPQATPSLIASWLSGSLLGLLVETFCCDCCKWNDYYWISMCYSRMKPTCVIRASGVAADITIPACSLQSRSVLIPHDCAAAVSLTVVAHKRPNHEHVVSVAVESPRRLWCALLPQTRHAVTASHRLLPLLVAAAALLNSQR